MPVKRKILYDSGHFSFTGKWQLSVNAIEYVHSSAKFYICGEQGIYPVLNFRELDDIDLNSFPE